METQCEHGSPILEARGLGVSYRAGLLGRRRVEALHDINLEVRAGEVCALIGANGSGKSSLLRCILGFLEPTSGQARLFGAAPDPRQLFGKVGVVLDGRLPLGRLSGLEFLTLTLNLAGHRSREARGRAASVLERLGLGAAMRRAHGSWSTGMERRLAFADAIALEAPLLVLDEPDSGLDPLALSILRRELEAHRARGGAAIVATHVLDALGADLFDRVLVLSKGRRVAFGPPAQVLGGRRVAEALADFEAS